VTNELLILLLKITVLKLHTKLLRCTKITRSVPYFGYPNLAPT